MPMKRYIKRFNFNTTHSIRMRDEEREKNFFFLYSSMIPLNYHKWHAGNAYCGTLYLIAKITIDSQCVIKTQFNGK